MNEFFLVVFMTFFSHADGYLETKETIQVIEKQLTLDQCAIKAVKIARNFKDSEFKYNLTSIACLTESEIDELPRVKQADLVFELKEKFKKLEKLEKDKDEQNL